MKSNKNSSRGRQEGKKKTPLNQKKHQKRVQKNKSRPRNLMHRQEFD